MKKLAITLAVFISFNVFSQEKQEFKTELNENILQCESIGRTIIDKNKTTNLSEWYEGRNKELAEKNIKQLESDINNSLLDVNYQLTIVYEEFQLYRLSFFNKETKLEIGLLYLSFGDKRNNLVNRLQFLSKEKMEMLDFESYENLNLLNTSFPFKKNGN